MKRWMALALIATSGIAALVWSERRPVEVSVSPAALLYFIADSEWELSRLPVSLTRLSDREEIDIGNRLARSYSSLDDIRRLPPEPRQQAQIVAAYVTRVGARIAARAHRKLPYRFHYIPDANFVNSFALPGGHVFIGAGLIELMDSEDELAAVLGHEIEHIDHYHCAERVQLEARLRKIPLGELLVIPARVFEAGYSKDQELEADREGTRLAVWGGYSPLGAIRMFETFDRLYREYVRRARSPQEELSSVAIETLGGYFRSQPPPSERIAQIRKMINDENWVSLNRERDLEVAYIFWTERAQHAYGAGHYNEAAGWAQRSLEANPNQPGALVGLGYAQFAQANFSEAALAFGKALETTPYGDVLVATYGDALAARHTPAQSLQEFEALLAKRPELRSRWAAGIELAGLTLAARGEGAAEAVVSLLNRDANGGLLPEARGRLGWWYYHAGKFDRAVELMAGAVQERPADARMQTQLAWALVEQRNLESAIQRFHSVIYQDRTPVNSDWKRQSRIINEAHIGLAVAYRQSQVVELAKNEFSGASRSQPEWMNPQWVGALYSPGVVKTIDELKAEQRAPQR